MSSTFSFPKDFLWGAATSSHQVEGNNRNNDWWEWESDGKVREPSGRACDQYNLFKDDFKLARELNHNAHRFSLEWSRIEPEKGRFDDSALEHYRDMIRELSLLGIKPVVTLTHFTLPVWLSEEGGWLAEKSEDLFAAFVEKAVEALGENVEYWVTLNEPAVNIFYSYIDGPWPPGHHSFREAVKVFVRLLKAHCLAYASIHRIHKKNAWKMPKVSIAKHVLVLAPCRAASIFDNLSARLRHYYFNRLFVQALLTGWCIAPGAPITRLPVKRSLDFLGINYYTRDFVHYAGLMPPAIFGDICTLAHHENQGKRNFLKWEIYPQGMYDVLKEYARFNLPILITENGICTDNDKERRDFIKTHLREIARVMNDGVSVLGYLYWSFMDNFEWAHGYEPRFGLVEVDYATQRRTVRPSARTYAEIIKNNSV